MAKTYHRRGILRAGAGLAITGLAGCAAFGERIREGRREDGTNNDSRTNNGDKSMTEGFRYTAYPEEVTDVLTARITPTADCKHSAALATSEDDVDLFDWESATKEAQRFAHETDFSDSVLLAVRTTSSGPITYEIDELLRLDDATIKAVTTAKSVPGPSTPEEVTRLVRVQSSEPVPERAVVRRESADPERTAFEYATDDETCPES